MNALDSSYITSKSIFLIPLATLRSVFSAYIFLRCILCRAVHILQNFHTHITGSLPSFNILVKPMDFQLLHSSQHYSRGIENIWFLWWDVENSFSRLYSIYEFSVGIYHKKYFLVERVASSGNIQHSTLAPKNQGFKYICRWRLQGPHFHWANATLWSLSPKSLNLLRIDIIKCWW